MIKGTNVERLEQEIAHLIAFISKGREVFFKRTGYSLKSSDEFVENFKTLDLFQDDEDLIQLDLNVQLLYIKLISYYEALERPVTKELKEVRHAFAHARATSIFRKKVDYNLFLYKAAKNFKKLKYIFYSESLKVASDDTTRTIVLNLDQDINDFLSIWNENESARKAS